MIRKTILWTILALLSIDTQATHLVSADLTYSFREKLPNNAYRYDVYLKVVRDLESGIGFDDEVHFGVYDRVTKKRVKALTTKLNATFVLSQPPCLNVGGLPELKYEMGVYHRVIDLEDNDYGYFITWNRCCRNRTNNLTNNSSGTPDQGFYPLAELVSVRDQNTSAPLDFSFIGVCINKVTTWSTSYFDEDGDSVVVDNVAPLVGGSSLTTGAAPEPPVIMPSLDRASYKSGHSFMFPFSTDGEFKRLENNVFQVKSVENGYYSIGLKVSEFRDGNLIGSRHVDATVIALSCSDTNGTIAPQNLTAKRSYDMDAALQWEACETEIDHYDIYRKKEGSAFSKIASTSSWVHGYMDTAIQSPGKYTYYVKGINQSDPNASLITNEAHVNIFNLSASDLGVSSNILVFPNPVTHVLSVRSEKNIDWIQLISAEGKLVLVSTLETVQKDAQLDMQEVRNGVYIVRVASGGSIYQTRIVKLVE